MKKKDIVFSAAVAATLASGCASKPNYEPKPDGPNPDAVRMFAIMKGKYYNRRYSIEENQKINKIVWDVYVKTESEEKALAKLDELEAQLETQNNLTTNPQDIQ